MKILPLFQFSGLLSEADDLAELITVWGSNTARVVLNEFVRDLRQHNGQARHGRFHISGFHLQLSTNARIIVLASQNPAREPNEPNL